LATKTEAAVRISLTGTVSIEANGTTLDERRFPGRQGRLVFAYLLAEHGRPVPRDELAEALWGESPPATWEKALAVLVSKLRALLEECGVDGRTALTSAFGCYQLTLPEGAWIDVAAAAEAVEAAETALGAGAPREARERAAVGAALARRSFLPGEHGDWVEEKRRELQSLLVRALTCLADTCVQTSAADEAVKHADELVGLEPYRDSGYRRLMLAHSAAGDNAEALRVYERCRRLLADELGAFPSAETESVYLKILRATPGPSARASAEGLAAPRPRLTHRRRLLALVLVPVVVATAAVAISRSSDSGADSRVAPSSVALIDAGAGRVLGQLRVGSRPAALAAGGGFAWVAGEDGTVSRVDVRRHVVKTAELGRGTAGIVYARGSLWATVPDERSVAQVDPETLRVLQRIEVGNGPGAITAGAGALWVANTIDGTVSRIDLTRGSVVSVVAVGGRPAALAFGAGAVWVANQEGATVTRLDPGSGQVLAVIEVGNGPSAVAAGRSGVWVANRHDWTVSRLDPRRDAVAGTIPVAAAPTSLAVGADEVWVAGGEAGTLLRLDAGTGRIEGQLAVGSGPNALALAGGHLWAATLPALKSHRGGVLRVESGPLICPCSDPAARGFSGPVPNLAYDGLLAYRRVGGIAGGELVADLAARVPAPADGGRTYTFRLRRGLRFSNGAVVRASDFRSSLERLLRINREARSWFTSIVGAASCAGRAARPCDLSAGIETDDATGRITIHLSAPDPDFLYALTLPYASVLPRGTPPRPREGAIPATGPYRVARVVPGRTVRLVRNPHFHVWSRDARPDGFADEIRLRISDDAKTRLAAVERGAADWVSGFPAAWLERLVAKHGARIHADAAPWIDYMFLNTRVSPFDDPRVRRALNYAVDRRRIVELAGGSLAARPTCQLLPSAVRSYRPICPYTSTPGAAGTWTAPDLARARTLVAASGTRGTKIEVLAYEAFGRVERVAYARYFTRLLRQLGYRSSVRVIPDIQVYVDYVGDSRHRVQIGTIGWVADFAAPSAVLRALFGCAEFLPEDRLNRNFSEFCNRRIDSVMARASAVQATDPVRADGIWARAERALVAQAPAVPLVERRAVALVSSRVGNYQYHPQLGTLFDQLWVR
jgi:ABC-type transport system substrate-binding protein/DNA-binding SARP family transcriptional activator